MLLEHSAYRNGEGSGKLLRNDNLMYQNTRRYNTLTPWSRGIPEKLTGPQLLKKFPAF
jgi:hypothetical protein